MDYKTTYMWKEISEAERVVKELLPKNKKAIDAVVEAVEKRGIKNICLAARGTSDHALIFFKYAVEILSGYTAGYVAPSVVTMYDGKVDYGNSLVIGCSQSGHAADVIAVIEKANAQGGVTLALTNDESSPLAKVAAHHIYLNAGKEISVAATKTFTAQLYALLCLAAALAHRDDLLDKYAKLDGAVAKMIKEADALTDVDSDRLKGMHEGFVLARGITYAIAFESALKLQETCYIRMRGYAMSDFYHGPMAMVSDGTQVLIYAPGSNDENALSDRRKCIDKMISLGGSVTLITDSDALAKEYDGKVALSRLTATNDEYVAMFGFALYAQLLACKISCKIGNDPDNPKALNKITITR